MQWGRRYLQRWNSWVWKTTWQEIYIAKGTISIIQALCAFNKSTPILKQISDSNFYLKNTPTSLNFTPTSTLTSSWCRAAEVVRKHKGPSPKILDLDENLSPNIRYFVAILRFVYGQKSVFFLGQKQCFLSKKCTITW